MLTCKEFLRELNDFLDQNCDPSLRADIEKHLDECPNCFVICDTTQKTIRIFKGMQAKAIPEGIRSRLMSAIERRCKGSSGNAAAKGKPGGRSEFKPAP